MMAPSRGPFDAQTEVRSVSNSSASSSSITTDTTRIRSRRHLGALERRLSNVVEVPDASRLMECSQIQRQIRFQHLVRRYISQILYGCNTTYCTTPTCLSCNKRLVSRPFRAPTQLTARALAHFLASQDNPDSGLCPHRLNVDPDSLEIEGASDIEVRTDGSSTGSHSPADIHRHAHRPKSTSKRTEASRRAQYKHEMDGSDKVMTSVKERVQTRKDKSLGQNLYDTVTIIYSYSKQIPSPLSVFASLRSPPSPRHKSVETYSARDSNVETTLGPCETSLDVELAGHANGHVTSSNVNGARTSTQTNAALSQPPPKMPRRSSTPITVEVLSNGQRIHRVRHNLVDAKSNGHPSLKVLDPISLDGTLELSGSQICTMKKKPAGLELRSMPNNSSVTSASLGSSRDNSTKLSEGSRNPTLPVAGHLNCEIMDQLKEEVYQHRNELSSDFNFVVDYDTNRRFRPTKPFVNRSMFFTLSDPETLLMSFRDNENKTYENSPLPHLNSTRLIPAFRDWNRRNGALIFDSLWIAVEALFRPPPELDVQKSPRLKPSRKQALMSEHPGPSCSAETPGTLSGRYLSDEAAAHIVMICIHALTSLVSVGWPHTWVQLRKFRSWGIILPDAPPHTDFTGRFVDPWLSIIDELEYEPALRLADRLVRGIGARMCFEQILAALGRNGHHPSDAEHPVVESRLLEVLIKHLGEVESNALAKKSKTKTNLDYTEDPGWTVTATFMEWLRTIIIKKWDGKAEVNRWDSIGAAVTLMDKFHTNRDLLNLRTHMFYMPILHERLDPVSTPLDFLTSAFNPNFVHLFQYLCFFPPDYLVPYFRTINFTEMFKHFERTERAVQLQRGLDPFLREPYWWQIRNSLKTTFSDYLVLDVKRESALKDTLDQLWRAERRLLLKPLKVKMGMQEGEVGLDQGGVTSEFFRIVLNDAFKPDNGMFTVDPTTQMTHFQPCALEPLYKFELLGILFSLAVYNGITLPVTFPLAFYYNLLPKEHPSLGPKYPNTTDFIRDGWPQLAKSFDELLAWTDGDVEDVFCRSYEFSFEAFGQRIDVDMRGFESRPWPAQYAHKPDPKLEDVEELPASNEKQPLNSRAWERPMVTYGDAEPSMVSNHNRAQYVQDYIYWLTHRSVAPQMTAFQRGFMSCLHPKSLWLFTPESLRSLVEGTQTIDIEKLRKATRYEAPYTASHPTITMFWSIVEAYDQGDRKHLLEFVTASERVPVTGFGSMQFVICRAGADSEHLPTSSTCFGKFMLPEYGSEEKMKGKLDLAIRNAQGFGIV